MFELPAAAGGEDNMICILLPFRPAAPPTAPAQPPHTEDANVWNFSTFRIGLNCGLNCWEALLYFHH